MSIQNPSPHNTNNAVCKKDYKKKKNDYLINASTRSTLILPWFVPNLQIYSTLYIDL